MVNHCWLIQLFSLACTIKGYNINNMQKCEYFTFSEVKQMGEIDQIDCVWSPLALQPHTSAICREMRPASSGTASVSPSCCCRDESSWVTISSTWWPTSERPRFWHPGREREEGVKGKEVKLLLVWERAAVATAPQLGGFAAQIYADAVVCCRGAELFQATIVKAVRARLEEERKSVEQLKRQWALNVWFLFRDPFLLTASISLWHWKRCYFHRTKL